METANLNWIDEITRLRRTQASTVVLAETLDPKRLDQLLEAKFYLKGRSCTTCGKGPHNQISHEYKPWDFRRKVIFNLQTGLLTDFDGHQIPEQKSPDQFSPPVPPMVILDGLLRQDDAQTLVIIKWAFFPPACAQLQDYLLDWSQNEEIKKSFSMAVILTNDLNLTLDGSRLVFTPELQRWSIIVKIPSSLDQERNEQLKNLYQQIKNSAVKSGLEFHTDEYYEKGLVPPEHTAATKGLNFLDLERAVFESFAAHKSFKTEVFSQYKVKNILQSYNIKYVEPSFGFEAVMGYDYLKTYFKSRIIAPMLNPEKYLAEGIKPPKGMVLCGPPRTGKTYLAHALAKESKSAMMTIQPSDLMSSLVGGTERLVARVFEVAESLAPPLIIFIDEGDSILRKRSAMAGSEASDAGTSIRMISSLLAYTGDEKRQAFIIVATNNVEAIDEAFLSTGRLDKSAIMLYPDYESRKQIILHYSKGKKLAKDVDIDRIAQETTMWNNAELAMLPDEAAIVRFELGDSEIRTKHFDTAIERAFKIDTQGRKVKMQQMIHNYTTSIPNYEPWLLDEAKKTLSNEKDRSLSDAFTEAMIAN